MLRWLSFRRVSILFYVVALFTPFLRMQQQVWGDGGGLLNPEYHLGLESLLLGWGIGYFWPWFSNIIYFTILANRAPKAILFVLSVINIVLALQLIGFTEYSGRDFMRDYFYYHVSLQSGYAFWLSSYVICSLGLFLNLINTAFVKLEINPSNLFKGKNLFLIDALGACLTVFMLTLVLSDYQSVFGIPKEILGILAIVGSWFAIYSFYCYFLVKSFKTRLMRQIVYHNLFYCLLTIALLIFLPNSITLWGVLYFLGEVVIILGLTKLEWKASKAEG